MAQGRKKGGAKTGGRAAGATNKITGRAKDMIAAFLDNTASEFQGWVNTVAQTDPHKACDIYLKALEFNLPKLARTILEGDKNNPINVLINYPHANKPTP